MSDRRKHDFSLRTAWFQLRYLVVDQVLGSVLVYGVALVMLVTFVPLGGAAALAMAGTWFYLEGRWEPGMAFFIPVAVVGVVIFYFTMRLLFRRQKPFLGYSPTFWRAIVSLSYASGFLVPLVFLPM